MEETLTEQPQIPNQYHEMASKLLIEQKKSSEEVKHLLVQEGLDTVSALKVIGQLKSQIDQTYKEQANKDMVYGALWCLGGIIGTMGTLVMFFGVPLYLVDFNSLGVQRVPLLQKAKHSLWTRRETEGFLMAGH